MILSSRWSCKTVDCIGPAVLGWTNNFFARAGCVINAADRALYFWDVQYHHVGWHDILGQVGPFLLSIWQGCNVNPARCNVPAGAIEPVALAGAYCGPSQALLTPPCHHMGWHDVMCRLGLLNPLLWLGAYCGPSRALLASLCHHIG